MKKIIRSILIISILCFASATAATMPTFADNICNNANVSREIRASSGCPSAGTGKQLPSVIVNILNGVIGVIGIVSVVYTVVGGVNYMTSAGDTGKTEKARKTIIYSLIGLVICALAFAIVNFVIKNIIG